MRKEKKMIKVLTGGAYDIVHSGHVKALQRIKQFGDYLIVNINPDYRIKQKKGETRPVLSEAERMYIVLNLKPVDEVVCIKGKTENGTDYVKMVINRTQPDIYVSSSKNKEIQAHCKDLGIIFIHLPDIPGIDKMHSEDIIRKIKKGHFTEKRRTRRK